MDPCRMKNDICRDFLLYKIIGVKKKKKSIKVYRKLFATFWKRISIRFYYIHDIVILPISSFRPMLSKSMTITSRAASLSCSTGSVYSNFSSNTGFRLHLNTILFFFSTFLSPTCSQTFTYGSAKHAPIDWSLLKPKATRFTYYRYYSYWRYECLYISAEHFQKHLKQVSALSYYCFHINNNIKTIRTCLKIRANPT